MTIHTPHLLLIEDDAELSQLISDFLLEAGYHLTVAANAKEAVYQGQSRRFDLIICDVMLPDQHGFDLAKQLLQHQQCPLIFLTALGDDETHIRGLQQGAVDFLTKPVKPAILLARIKVNLLKQAPAREVSRLQWFRYVFDDRAKTMTSQGRDVALTNQEYDILRIFINHAGTPISRDFLFQQLVGRPYDGCDRAADLKISRLRKKLHDCGCDDITIKTLRSQGYVLIHAQPE